MARERDNGTAKLQNGEILQKELLPLTGSSAVITGATRLNGIGLAIAERLALEGASPIIIVGTENSRDIAPLAVERIKRYSNREHRTEAYNLVGDITNEASCNDIIAQSYALCDGNVDILVNNASTNRDLNITDATTEDWRYIMEPKALGAFLMAKEWFRVRDEASIKGGRVINIGSVVGLYGNYGQDLYAMANGALLSLTTSLRLRFGSRGITVNAIAPYFVEGTDMTEAMASKMDLIKAAAPLPHTITPQDIGGIAAFFAGPDAKAVNGAILPVDCGAMSNYTAFESLRRAGYRLVPRNSQGEAKS